MRKPYVGFMSEIHTIFGAGQVGVQLARILAEQGKQVRLVRRSPAGPAIDGVVWLRGDVTDESFADEACRGASVVYNCTNPPDYHRWGNVLVPLFTAVWKAAARAGARVVVLDNLYMYGRPETVPFDERTPMRPCSEKGALRKQLVDELFAAHARGEVVATSGRASDYFGPDTPKAVLFNPRFFARLNKGAAVEVMGDADQPHSYSYTPDVARGLAILGTHEAAVGRAWHLPVAAQLTSRELIERFAAAAGRPVKLRRVPRWLLEGVGMVVPLVRAVVEMLYQFEMPYVLDDADFRRTFGIGPTPLDEAIDATLRSHDIEPVNARQAA
jgi:nucleoside-diphosphate-sugar epimerase